MATVFIPTLLQAMTGGRGVVEAEGSTVRRIVEDLDRQFPGIAERLADSGRLRPNVSVAVDGEVSPLGMLEQVGQASEVHFVTAIKGGSSPGAWRSGHLA